MRKKRRRSARSGEMSAGRVEYLEAARSRARGRRLRNTAVLVFLAAALVFYLTGALDDSVLAIENLADSAKIALTPGPGFPQQTGVGAAYQAEWMDGAFVVLGEEGCAVYSDDGARLSSLQTGYARPAIAAGKNNFVLYNRSGSELRVASRTRSLYTRQTEGSIFLCAVGDGGQLAVVTDDTRKLAQLTVYSAAMEELLTWAVTSEVGVPVRMAFSPNGTQLAVAAVTARSGRIVTNLYLLGIQQGGPQLLASEEGYTPVALEWLSNSRFIAAYDGGAALYGSDGAEQARRDFGGESAVSCSAGSEGLAVLFGGASSSALILDAELAVRYEGPVPASDGIVLGSGCFYLLCDSSVECFDQSGGYLWSEAVGAKPQALLAGDEPLVFADGTVRQITPPEPEQ